MNAAELDALLRQFLVDQKLSPHERGVLADWVAKNLTTDHQRGVARHQLFEAARNAIVDSAAGQVISFVEDALRVLLPMTSGAGQAASSTPDEAFFSPGDACLSRIINRFANARRTVDICVFTITDDRISRSILDAHKRGVRLRIITDNDKAYDLGSDAESLRAAGIPLKTDRTPFHMHHKFAIFDGARLLNGSYNWTRGAAEQNMENVTDSGDTNLIGRFQREFDAIWEKLD